MKEQEIKTAVRKNYAAIASHAGSCCGTAGTCGDGTTPADGIGKKIGYSDKDLSSVPEDSNLGLGCGNPTALTSLKEGETVLDLGSGAGFDCFLAAQRVGKAGKVIGVDMTPEMIEKAKKNARKGGYENVEFRLGEIENIPAADNSFDAVISNCVINLAPEKRRVFSEAFRVLKPGGRLMVSDIVLTKELPGAVKNSLGAYVNCIAGAAMKGEYLQAIQEAGFRDVSVVKESKSMAGLFLEDPSGISGSIASITVKGTKPH